MIRVNIEPGAIPRAIKLGKYAGVSAREALGTVALLWAESQDQLRTSGSETEILEWAGLDELEACEREIWLGALVRSRFLSLNDDGTYLIHGNEIQIEGRVSRVKAAHKGGAVMKKRWAEIKAKSLKQSKGKTGSGANGKPPGEPEASHEASQYKTRQSNTGQDKATPPEGSVTAAEPAEVALEFDLAEELGGIVEAYASGVLTDPPIDPDAEASFWASLNEQAEETLAEIEPMGDQLPLALDLPETHEDGLGAADLSAEYGNARYLSPDDLAVLWSENAGANCTGLRDLTEARRKKARAQIKKYPDRIHWLEAVERFAEHTVPDWKPGFDDFLDETKRTRALEGKYAGRRGGSRPQATMDKLADQARRIQEGTL